MRKPNLFNRESETSDGDGGNKEEEEGDPEKREPWEGHGKPATPRPALLVAVYVIRWWLLEGQAKPQPLKVSQISIWPSVLLHVFEPINNFHLTLFLFANSKTIALSPHLYRPPLSPIVLSEYVNRINHKGNLRRVHPPLVLPSSALWTRC